MTVGMSPRANPLLVAARASVVLGALLALVPAAGAGEPPRELKGAIDEILQRSALSGARVGILVADVESGKALYARDADVLLNPASNVKLFTSAAVLSRLGPEFRFETEFRVDPASRGKSTARTLYVRGKGDPTLVTERLWAIAGDLAGLGLQRIGELVLDDGYFDDERIGPGFDQESGDRAYLAPTGALSLNFNSVAIHATPGEAFGRPGRVSLEPQSDYLELVNRTRTVAARAIRRVVPSSTRDGARQRIVVDGRLPVGSRPVAIWRKIDDPRAYFGQTLKRLLELRGVKVGRVRAGAAPEGTPLIHVAESESLGEIVRRLNKTSNNFVAEQLLKTLGAETHGAPGTWSSGIDAAEEFLAEVGLPRGSFVMRNGSGLNDANRFSARQTVTLLRAMWHRFPVAAEFLASLPMAGRDGTIRWRMDGTDAAGHLRAKTGTLENVTSLSGYVETVDREQLAFSIFVNDFAGRASRAARVVDAVAAAVAAKGGGAKRLGDAVALLEPTPPPTAGPSLQEQRAVVQTWRQLARAADRRNLTLLRTALRAEREPALRLAIAECIYESDPDGESAQRALLDTVASAAAALPRLAALSAEPGQPAPILPALGTLAADGDAEALTRLFELAPVLAADPRLSDALGDVLAGVAQSAPRELVDALRAAPQPLQEAVAGSIASGILRSDDDEKAFERLLRELASAEDSGASFARALEQRMAAAEAAARAPKPSDQPSIGPAPSGPPELRPGG
jgi:D-alanyl-D-alanine carboxypeptidase/D-alanyl-D-alanine-endopeptidase (penicillin-binding protein 4)